MGSTGIATVLALVAGLGGAAQIAVQGRLADRGGSLAALACATAAAVTAVVVLRR